MPHQNTERATEDPARSRSAGRGSADSVVQPAGTVGSPAASLYVNAFDSLPVAMAILNADADIISVNQAWRRFAADNGGSAAGYVGYNYLAVCRAATGPDAAEAGTLLRSLLAGECRYGELEYRCHAPARRRWFVMQAWRFHDGGDGGDGGQLRLAVMHLDVTRRHLFEDALRERAERDPLTGLLNRASFQERGEQALAQARRLSEPVSLLFLDLNKFKSVNDSFGHETGDAVLCEVARRFAAGTREADAPARVGGDEFVVLLAGADSNAASVMAERIRELTSQPFEVDGHSLTLSCAVGIATARDGQTTVQRLLQEADQAMYAEKHR